MANAELPRDGQEITVFFGTVVVVVLVEVVVVLVDVDVVVTGTVVVVLVVVLVDVTGSVVVVVEVVVVGGGIVAQYEGVVVEVVEAVAAASLAEVAVEVANKAAVVSAMVKSETRRRSEEMRRVTQRTYNALLHSIGCSRLQWISIGVARFENDPWPPQNYNSMTIGGGEPVVIGEFASHKMYRLLALPGPLLINS